MKRIALAALLGFMLSGGVAANPIYRFSFSGTITEGSASSFNPSVSGNSLTPFADLTGLKVSGWLDFDLGLAPPPDVTVDLSGFISTAIQSNTLPVFTSHQLVIEGLTVPSGFFAVPAVFNQPVIPTIAGSATTTITSNQSLSTQARDAVSAQSIVGGLSFQNSWAGPRFVGGNLSTIAALASSLQAFYTVPPLGNFPDEWGPASVGGNGVFGLSVFATDSTIPANFGITEWYDVGGRFQMESASGGIVTPEPATLGVGVAALVLVALRIRLIRIRKAI